MINILIESGTSQMSSGATHSLLKMAMLIRQSKKYYPIIILNEHGDLEEYLKEKQIEYYIIESKEIWIKLLNSKPSRLEQIKSFIKKPFRRPWNALQIVKLKKILVKRQIKLLHINALTIGFAAIAANELNIPIIWHMREFMEEDIDCTFYNKIKSIDRINKAKMLIAVSDSVKEKYQTVFKPPIQVVYNGVDIGERSVRPHNFHKDRLSIAIIGRICEKKGQMELLQAVAMLPEKYKNKIELHVIGSVQDKDYNQKMKDTSVKLELQNKVYFAGFCSNILEKLREIDCVCICSEKEAFGRTTVEGMMAGCIIVGANTGGTKELIQDHKTGYLYCQGNQQDLTEKLKYILNHRTEAEAIASYSQVYAHEKFSAQKNAENIIKCYDDILKV